MTCTHPLSAATSWPNDRPLMMLYSGGSHSQWSTKSLVASPVCAYQFDGRSRWIGDVPGELSRIEFTHDPLADVNRIVQTTAENSDHSRTKNRGGWMGYFSYDLGCVIEPRARAETSALSDRTWPLIHLAWCPDIDVFVQTGHGDSRHGHHGYFTIGEPRSAVSPDEYMRKVQQTKEYIAAGDIFQANITQRMSASFSGSARHFAARALAENQPWFGGYMELHQLGDDEARAIVSLSPEVFLDVDFKTRRIITRPMKGTRPASCNRRELEQSAKDTAELTMIVDLMRNDLGRICEFGSVQVSQPRVIETHGTVHQAVGEVTGRLHHEISVGDILRATFPGGSVTGAPKIRAMQIIDELEPVRRGPYCGAIGFISDAGHMTLNIAIRTALITGIPQPDRMDEIDGRLDYSVGAGIVADSQPESELAECMTKAEALLNVQRGVMTPEPQPAAVQFSP